MAHPPTPPPKPTPAALPAASPVPASSRHERALWIAFGLTGTYLIAEVIGGLVTGSLALLSDAAHMLTDVAALAIAVIAVRIARRPADVRRTFGYHRVEVLAAAVNVGMLFAAAIYILIEAVRRFREPPEVQSIGMLIIATIGLAVNLGAMWVLRRAKGESLNVKGAYLEVWSDMLGSLGVIAAAIVIRFTGWRIVDAIVGVGIGLFVLPRAWGLLRETLNVLMEGVPAAVDLARLRADLAAIPGVASGVQAVHDLHAWSLSSGRSSMSVHLVLSADAGAQAGASRALVSAARQVALSHGIDHVTVQVERDGEAEGESTH